jgi:YesN/AraC family two-component response regulator
MNILIVDDDDVICRNIESKLKRLALGLDFDVQSANSADEATAIYENSDIDLIITDIHMPGKNGLIFIENIRKNDEDVLIFVLSGYDDYEYVRKAFLLKVTDYLLKPISITELHEKIAKHFRGEATKAPQGDHSMMQKVLRYIHDNICSDISMNDAAVYASMSYNYFSKIFKEYTGLAFPTYVLQIRMERAKEYLNDPFVKIKDISVKLGYKDAHLFSRAFKRYTGKYPAEYRGNGES